MRIAVVIGSTRPGRICPSIANWVRECLASGDGDVKYEIVDIADLNLPLLDEPLMAALHQYEHEHTKQWSAIADSYEGFFFVLPQYNWGYPAALKNALDFLYDEWSGKPASFLTYGSRGGNCAAAQFAEVLQGLHMKVLDHVEVETGAWNGDAEEILAPYREEISLIDAAFTCADSGTPGPTVG